MGFNCLTEAKTIHQWFVNFPLYILWALNLANFSLSGRSFRTGPYILLQAFIYVKHWKVWRCFRLPMELWFDLNRLGESILTFDLFKRKSFACEYEKNVPMFFPLISCQNERPRLPLCFYKLLSSWHKKWMGFGWDWWPEHILWVQPFEQSIS